MTANDYYGSRTAELSELVGKILFSVERCEIDNQDCIIFKAEDGSEYALTHYQDCCESVYIESIAGELSDLVGSLIVRAESSCSEGIPVTNDSSTWTFYKFATIKGYVDIRWCGESNGYYSEAVEFVCIKEAIVLNKNENKGNCV